MLLLLPALIAAAPPAIEVDRDDVRITESCTLRVSRVPIADGAGDGVVQIVADGVTVELEGALRGASEGYSPDKLSGTGIRVLARDVTLRGGSVSGYRVGIRAGGAHGLVVEDCDVSGNFRQRLGSTARAEDGADWLWPHVNDGDEWLAAYGAGLWIEDSDRVTVRRVRCRRGQNGIVLDRVDGARVYDNDCSFLSGWGLAMWRSSHNLVSRNAFDFCIRGYSHGVYNRGQDSAGILMFEQCCDNLIVENSATHCGDGFFGFAGREALGQDGTARDLAFHRRRGNNDNRIAGNDFSDAAAHGIEMTFSFGNRIEHNRLADNAICGIWSGYSQETTILGNRIEDNGGMGYGAERGGVNIEHGRNNGIVGNTFRGNRCGVFLWWDEDADLLATEWARANRPDSADNAITLNRFEDNEIDVQLRLCDRTRVEHAGPIRLDADERSRGTLAQRELEDLEWDTLPGHEALGDTRPVGARAALRGREHIVMTEWGPYDWGGPLLHLEEHGAALHAYRVLAPSGVDLAGAAVGVEGEVDVSREGGRLSVTPRRRGAVVPYALRVQDGETRLEARGALAALEWQVRAFAWSTDPREDLDAWRNEGERHGASARLDHLDLRYGGGGPADLGIPAFRAIPPDRFGTIARARVTIPAGSWRIRTVSDDGIRVSVDEEIFIDDWTFHPPKENSRDLDLAEERTLEIRVEHFELDGHAVLSLDIEPR